MVRVKPLAFAAVLLSFAGGCSGGGGGGSDPRNAPWKHVEGSRGSINYDPTFLSNLPQLTALGSKLYAIWLEMDTAASPAQVRVAVYGGDDASPAWKLVDGGSARGLNEDPAASALYPQLTAVGGKLYATWEELGIPLKTVVAVYGGDDASPRWTFVHGAGVTGLDGLGCLGVDRPQLTALGTRLYAAWWEACVAVYNGDDLAPAWTRVDAGVGTASSAQLTVFGSKLYATWSESSRVRVLVYNGDDAAPSWRYVDSGGLYAAAADLVAMPQLTVRGSTLYAAWSEGIRQGSRQIRVAAYGGNDAAPAWSFVDGGGPKGLIRDPALVAEFPQLTANGAKLYAAWSERDIAGTSSVVHVAEYGGNDASPTWAFVDGGDQNGLMTPGVVGAGGIQLTAFQGRLYAAWQEQTATTSVRVRVAVAPF
jgi:hypothetical protein